MISPTLKVLEAMDTPERSPMSIREVAEVSGVSRRLTDNYMRDYAKRDLVESVKDAMSKVGRFRLTQAGWHYLQYRLAVKVYGRPEKREEVTADTILAQARATQANSVFALGGFNA